MERQPNGFTDKVVNTKVVIMCRHISLTFYAIKLCNGRFDMLLSVVITVQQIWDRHSEFTLICMQTFAE